MSDVKSHIPVTDNDILSSFRAGVLVLDRKGNIIFINRIGRKILNLPEETVKASPRDHFFKVLFSSFDSEYLPSRIEIELTTKGTGEKAIIGITLSDISRDGRREAIVAFFKDLSHIEKFSQAEGLKSRLMMLGQMAAGMAHEIRNPLASININTELIKRKISGTELHSLIDSILKDIKKVEDIVNQSLDFVKHDQIVKKPTDIKVFLGDIIYNLRNLYRKIDFQLSTEGIGEGDRMMVDGKLLNQALQNILYNAAQSYGEKRGRVHVSANVTEEYSDILKLSGPGDLKTKLDGDYKKRYLNVNVKDNGPGINSDIREKIFTPFFTTKRGGIGIGLPISQKIIHSHDGSIDVLSREGKGTEFRIKIPVK